MSDELRFAVATYGRVFDLSPQRDALTLAELIEALRRFQLRPDLARRIARELARVDAAWDAYSTGRTSAGPFGKAIAQAGREGGAEAAEQRARELRKDAERAAKRDLRIWSPTLYPDGAERHNDEVEALSAMVLDYDGDVTLEEASSDWRDTFHVVHTTWSHTAERHKFRLVLPFAHLVAARDYDRVFDWAGARAAGFDPTARSVSRAYALPVVSGPNAPHVFYTRPGALLHPGALGLAEPHHASHEPSPDPSGRMRGEEGKAFFVASDVVPWAAHDDPYDDDAVWDVGLPETSDAAGQAEASREVAATLQATAAPELLVTDGARERPPTNFAALSVPDALERLFVLFEAGALTDAEYAAAKARVLGLDDGV